MTENLKKSSVRFLHAGGHIPALDGIRGIAILLVMLHHFVTHGGMRPTLVLDRIFYKVAMVGWCGVDLFFVLSGFLITGILVDARESPFFFRNFYMRRILRIFPLYFGFLAVFFFALPMILPMNAGLQTLLEDQIWYWSYLVNLKIGYDGWPPFYALGHFWSLAVEEQFYIFWPFVVFLFRKHHLMYICMIFVFASLAVRVALVTTNHPLAAYALTPARMDALAFGGFLAVAARTPNGFSRLCRWAWPVAGLSAATLLGIVIWRRGFFATDIVMQTIGYTALVFFFGAVLSIAIDAPQDSILGKAFANKSLRLLGRYSYALYIFHHPIVFFMGRSVLRVNNLPTVAGSQIPGQIMFIILASVASLGLAVLSWHLYEVQFLKLKRFFPYQTQHHSKKASTQNVPPQRDASS